ncbi:MAG: DnaJ domain-containing protein [Gammaproteobacteria bacterium]|nr:DnaJ domain-containing protein [Gammaproteobacteria bacterium]
MKYKDYYQILGVNRDASAEDIKKAYRRLARKYHPDVSKEKEAEERFKEVGEAYDVLQDAKKREAYDRLGNQWQAGEQFTPPPGWQNETGFGGGAQVDPEAFSDFFSQLFGGGSPFRQQGHRRRSAASRGEDIHARLDISLEDAFGGATRELTLKGATHELKTLRVKIPKGVMSGQQIRLSGQGEPGIHGGPAGDLYIEVNYAPHPLFRVENKVDLYLTVPLTPWEAALGATLSVPTLGGSVDVKIPENIQSGKKLRLKGRGIPAKTPGDQYLVLEIMIPPAQNESARAFYQKMATELPFNPRQGWHA